MLNVNERLARSILAALHVLTSALDSLRDEEKRRVSERENYIPEAIGILSNIRDSFDAFIVESNTDNQKTQRFQRKSLRVQWWLFGATAAAFVAAAIYANVARLQKNTMDDTFKEMQKQTAQAQEANRLTVESERPWIGIAITVQGWVEGKVATSAVTFTNGGRRPAKLLGARFGNHEYVTFPESPDYPRQPTDVHSVVLIIPNGIASSAQPLGQVTHDRLNGLAQRQKKFFVYASADYEDVTTHVKHWIHACVQYLPGFTNQANGFVSCDSYNDIDQQ